MLKKVKQILYNWKYKNRVPYQTTQEVSFKDLAGKLVHLEIRANGNSTMLVLKDDKETIEFAFDKETSILLGALLQSYSEYNIFPALNE